MKKRINHNVIQQNLNIRKNIHYNPEVEVEKNYHNVKFPLKLISVGKKNIFTRFIKIDRDFNLCHLNGKPYSRKQCCYDAQVPNDSQVIQIDGELYSFTRSHIENICNEFFKQTAEAELELVVGKFYKLENGIKVKLIAFEQNQFIGLFSDAKNSSDFLRATVFSKEGKAIWAVNGHDIVSEWKEKLCKWIILTRKDPFVYTTICDEEEEVNSFLENRAKETTVLNITKIPYEL